MNFGVKKSSKYIVWMSGKKELRSMWDIWIVLNAVSGLISN